MLGCSRWPGGMPSPWKACLTLVQEGRRYVYFKGPSLDAWYWAVLDQFQSVGCLHSRHRSGLVQNVPVVATALLPESKLGMAAGQSRAVAALGPPIARGCQVVRAPVIVEAATYLVVKILRFSHIGIKSTIGRYGHAFQSKCMPPGKSGHPTKDISVLRVRTPKDGHPANVRRRSLGYAKNSTQCV